MPPVRRLPPAEQVDEAPYQLKTLKAPVLRGKLLKVFGWFLKTPIGTVVQTVLRRRSGIPQVEISLNNRVAL